MEKTLEKSTRKNVEVVASRSFWPSARRNRALRRRPVAKDIFLRLREVLGTIDEDEVFTDLFPMMGRPAKAPWRLTLISVLPCVEDLSDRQAAEAVWARHPAGTRLDGFGTHRPRV